MATNPAIIRLTWVNPATDETSVRVERSTTGTDEGWFELVSLDPGATTYDDEDLPTGSQFFYRVRNHKLGSGFSAYSNVADTTTLTQPVLPFRYADFTNADDFDTAFAGELQLSVRGSVRVVFGNGAPENLSDNSANPELNFAQATRAFFDDTDVITIVDNGVTARLVKLYADANNNTHSRRSAHYGGFQEVENGMYYTATVVIVGDAFDHGSVDANSGSYTDRAASFDLTVPELYDVEAGVLDSSIVPLGLASNGQPAYRVSLTYLRGLDEGIGNININVSLFSDRTTPSFAGSGTNGFYIGAQQHSRGDPQPYQQTSNLINLVGSTGDFKTLAANVFEPDYQLNQGVFSRLIVEAGYSNQIDRGSDHLSTYWTLENDFGRWYSGNYGPDLYGTTFADRIVKKAADTTNLVGQSRLLGNLGLTTLPSILQCMTRWGAGELSGQQMELAQSETIGVNYLWKQNLDQELDLPTGALPPDRTGVEKVGGGRYLFWAGMDDRVEDAITVEANAGERGAGQADMDSGLADVQYVFDDVFWRYPITSAGDLITTLPDIIQGGISLAYAPNFTACVEFQSRFIGTHPDEFVGSAVLQFASERAVEEATGGSATIIMVQPGGAGTPIKLELQFASTNETITTIVSTVDLLDNVRYRVAIQVVEETTIAIVVTGELTQSIALVDLTFSEWGAEYIGTAIFAGVPETVPQLEYYERAYWRTNPVGDAEFESLVDLTTDLETTEIGA